MLVLPVGIPGCGKSTLANLLIEAGVIPTRSVVSPDYFREWLTGDKGDQTANAQAWKISNLLATTRLSRSLSVYFDATNLVPSNYVEVLNEAMDYDHKIAYIFFDNKDQAIHRNAARKNPVPESAMDKMVARWRQWDPPAASATVRVFLHDSNTLEEDLREFGYDR